MCGIMWVIYQTVFFGLVSVDNQCMGVVRYKSSDLCFFFLYFDSRLSLLYYGVIAVTQI